MMMKAGSTKSCIYDMTIESWGESCCGFPQLLKGYYAMITLSIIPNEPNWPSRGGVREHLRQIYKCAKKHPDVAMPGLDVDIHHVESSFSILTKPDVYVCHGGFLPQPLPTVLDNLRKATRVVSVAAWLFDVFPQMSAVREKSQVIPNGVDLAEWEDIPPSGSEPGYVLYGKEFSHHITVLEDLVYDTPDLRFVTTFWEWPDCPENVKVVGKQPFEKMQSLIKDAGCLLLTGDEVCPTMLLEAWAARTPVAAQYMTQYAGGGSAELMLPNESSGDVGGRVFIPQEAERAIRTCLQNSKELGEQGRDEVEAKYQWKDLFERYMSLYYEIKLGDIWSKKTATT